MFEYTYMLETTELVEKTILGNVICEETAAADDATDDASPEMDEAAETDALEDELSVKLLKLVLESSRADEVALVI